MSYKDIKSHIEELYQISISSATINAITDKIISTVKEWQSRPLESVYPFVFMDAIHYTINLLRLQGQPINAYQVAKLSGVAYNTARKYLKNQN